MRGPTAIAQQSGGTRRWADLGAFLVDAQPQAAQVRGRDAVPIGELVEHLQKIVEEREEVVAAMKMGVDGPYTFEDSRWVTPDDILPPPEASG